MPQSKALSLSSVAHEYTSPLGDPPFSQIRRAQRCPQANATSLAQLTRRQFNPVKYMSVMRHDRFWDAHKTIGYRVRVARCVRFPWLFLGFIRSG